MTLLNGILSILGEFLCLPYMQYWFFPLISLAFLATVPRLIRCFLE